jgi:hypothetical protein
MPMSGDRRLPSRVGYLLGAAILLTPFPALAAGDGDQGFALRENALSVALPAVAGLPSNGAGVTDTRLRAWGTLDLTSAKLQAALEIHDTVSTISGLGLLGASSGPGTSAYEWVSLSAQSTSSAVVVGARLDRFDLTGHWGPVDLDLGRQPISLGTSHFVGVLDVLTPFAPGTLDSTYKPGVDAVRIRTAIADQTEAEAIVVGADPWGQGAALGRGRTSVAGIDLEAVVGRFRQRAIAGLGFEGGAGPLGIWGEAALFGRRPDVEQVRAGWSQAAFSGVAGIDWPAFYDFRLGTSVMYQDFGARRPEDLAAVRMDAPFQEGWVYLGSAGYGVVTLQRSLNPLWNLGVSGIVNLVDGSTLWQPRLTYSVSDNADLGVYAWGRTGAGSELTNGQVVVHSEFGSLPIGGGLYARWFF